MMKEHIVELKSIMRLIQQIDQVVFQNESINASQFRALEVLLEQGKISAGDLAGRLHVHPPVVTTLMDKLVKRELVLRFNDDQDRRVVCLSLLEQGVFETKRLLKKKEEVLKQSLEAIFSPLEIQTLNELLGKLTTT